MFDIYAHYGFVTPHTLRSKVQCLGPQGMGGDKSVMGVNIEHGSRHPSVISVAVNVGCWNHRRGHVVFDKDGKYEILSHKGVTF